MATRGRMTLLNRAPSRRRLATVAVVASTVALSACSSISTRAGGESDASPAASEKSADPVSLSVNVDDRAKNIPVDTRIKVRAEAGELDKVRVFYGKKGDRTRVDGDTRDGTTWVADDLLEPGKTYRVRVKGHNIDGDTRTEQTRFRTDDLALDEQAYPSMVPLQGETAGVGMPVIVRFDIPVTNRAAVERQLTVTSKPKVKGAWSWLSDTEVHYRPKEFWPAGTEVHVDVDINGIETADGIYGQESRSLDFKIGQKSVVSIMDVANHTLTVKVNGDVARILPATSGKDGFSTRRGTKLIMQKFDTKRMDAATTGIEEGSSEYYNIPDVQYAMRVTSSGEFIHAAPWSVGSQGSANVSHGCVGLNTDNARWLYNLSSRGDPVKFVNSARELEPGNGWTDWNKSFKEFKKGSALN